MNAISTAIPSPSPCTAAEAPRLSRAVAGNTLAIGRGFKARSFRAMELEVAMDPLVMVDHYVMTEPTFGVHPHAGMSAVSLLFEDSTGRFHNRDSLGNRFDLLPGDLYWLKAGSGALHDEAPTPGSRIHGLQVFINLPQRRRQDTPMSLLVRGGEMPVIQGDNYRVRVALGDSGGVRGRDAPDFPMTILDGVVRGRGAFVHRLEANRNAWVHAIDGELGVSVKGSRRSLGPGEALSISNPVAGVSAEIRLQTPGRDTAHFALFAAEPIGEAYVQKGPMVMGSAEEIEAAQQACDAGRFGRID